MLDGHGHQAHRGDYFGYWLSQAAGATVSLETNTDVGVVLLEAVILLVV